MPPSSATITASALGALLTLSGSSFAATITTATSVSTSSADVFKFSNTGNSYSLASGTTLNSYSDLRDLFGSAFSTIEPGNVTFSDNKAQGFASSVNVVLGASVSLGSYDLYVQDDEPAGGRSLREFRLYAGATMISDVTVLFTTGTQSYASVYAGSMLKISDAFTSAPATANYTLVFIQNRPSSSSSGVRALEFAAYAPEPGCLPLVALSAALLRRAKAA